MATSPSLQRAVDYIRNGIHIGLFAAGHYLPPVRQLARTAEVSPVTMQKAVGLLREEGVLAGHFGQRTVVPAPKTSEGAACGSAGHSVEPFRASKTWKRIADRIEKDILNGLHEPGSPLPSIKEIHHRYRTTNRTARKALQYLCDAGTVEPCGRGYRVPYPMRTTVQTSVALFVYSRRGYPVLSPFSEEFTRFMERRCAQARVGLREVGFSPDNGTIACLERDTGRPVSPREYTGMAGYLYVPSIPSEVHGKLLRELSRFRKPIAVLDEIGMWKDPAALPSTRWMKIVKAANPERAGEDIARFLLELGHRSIAFFSPFHKEAWSRGRYRGVVDVYRAAGLASNIRSFTVDRTFSDPYYIIQGARRCGLDSFLDFMEHHVHPDLRHNIDELVFDPPKRWEILCGLAEMQRWLKPRLEEALADRDITAWVLVNDHVASYAHDILARHNMKPPHRVSLISFDDSLAALRKGITSYNFNASAHATAMLDHLLRPFSSGRSGIMELKGSIIQRRSTAAAG